MARQDARGVPRVLPPRLTGYDPPIVRAEPELRASHPAVLLLAVVGLLSACGTPPPSASAATASVPPSATLTAMQSVLPSASVQPSRSGDAVLSLVACPAPRPISPACLDTSSNGETPDLTDAVKVGGSVHVALTVRNGGTVASSPITVLFFTYEPPAVATFLKLTACNGCTLHTDGLADGAEWPGLGPGDHQLEVTLTAVGRPSEGRDANGEYQWLFAAFAQPYSVAAHGAQGIDVSQAFGTGTGATPITAL